MHFSWERMPQLTQVQYQYEVSSKEGREKDELCFTHHGHRCNIYRNANLLTQKSLKEQTLDVFTHIHTHTHTNTHTYFSNMQMCYVGIILILKVAENKLRV